MLCDAIIYLFLIVAHYENDIRADHIRPRFFFPFGIRFFIFLGPKIPGTTFDQPDALLLSTAKGVPVLWDQAPHSRHTLLTAVPYDLTGLRVSILKVLLLDRGIVIDAFRGVRPFENEPPTEMCQ